VNALVDPVARLVIAHRGDSAHFPENTMASFAAAVAMGVDALELDVRMTRDGVPVVIHDATVDRTTNGSGLVGALTYDELLTLDAGARFPVAAGRALPFRDHGFRIPALGDVLAEHRDVSLIIEVKEAGAVAATIEQLRRFGAESRVLIDSVEHEAVAPFRGTGVYTGASVPEVRRLLRAVAWPRANRRLPYDALCIPRRYHGFPIPVRRLAAIARRVGVVTHVWTVNDPATARRLWQSGVHGIITDDPKAMLVARAGLSRTTATQGR
jgi:glycerophosphoryl diester phosphodiesterase